MFKAVAVVGPPFSGVTALLDPYQDRTIRLEKGSPQLLASWRTDSQKPGNYCSLNPSEDAWWILDGFHRLARQLCFVRQFVELRGIVEIQMDPLLWQCRIEELAMQNPARAHSFFQNAVMLKTEYDKELELLRRVSLKWRCPVVQVVNIPGSHSTPEQLEIALTALRK